MKALFINYANTESMLEKTQACDNNPEESSATKLSKHAASFYSLFTHFSYDSSKSKHNFCRGANCMKKFCRDLKKHAAEIISYEKKEIIPLTDEEIESYNNQKLCHVQKKTFS